MGDAPDPVAANNQDAAATVVTPQADLVMQKTGPFQLLDTNTIAFTLTVQNNGPSIATNVLVVDALPAVTAYDSAASSLGCIDQVGLVTCPVGDLLPNTGMQLTVAVNVGLSTTGFVTNQAIVASDTPDAVPGNDNEVHAVFVVDTDADGFADFADSDDDNDGMPDAFETLWSFDPKDGSDAGLDKDEDGFSNLQEYIADTLPCDAASFLRVKSIGLPPVTVIVDTSTNRRYAVEYVLDLPPETYAPVPGLENVPGMGPAHAFTDTNAPAARRNYRIRVKAP
jgi:uncharacterized repeat protein (TIGR01451 family)